MSGAGKIYLRLDAYELGQIVALLPDVAWNRMDRQLRSKIKDAQSIIDEEREAAIQAELAQEQAEPEIKLG